MDFTIQCIIAFVAMGTMDFAYAAWVSHISEKNSLKSSMWAVVIILLSGLVTSSYVHEPWLLIPVACGAFAGTWLSGEKERVKKWLFSTWEFVKPKSNWTEYLQEEIW